MSAPNSLEALMLSPRRPDPAKIRSRSLDADGDVNDSPKSVKSSKSTRSKVRSSSRTGRGRRTLDKLHASMGDLDLLDGGEEDLKSVGSAKKSSKHKRSKSKDSKKDKLREKSDGYGSDGALDEGKKRIRERRGDRAPRRRGDDVDPSKTMSLLVDSSSTISSRSKSPKPERMQSAPVRSLSPIRQKSAGTLKKLTNIFKKSGGASTSSLFHDSASTIGTEASTTTPPSSTKLGGGDEDPATEKAAGKKIKYKKKRASSTGPLTRSTNSQRGMITSKSANNSVSSDGPLVAADDIAELNVMDALKRSQSLSKFAKSQSERRGRSIDRVESTGALKDAPIATTKSRFRLQEEVEVLQQENQMLTTQLKKEIERSKKLRKQVRDLKQAASESGTESGKEFNGGGLADLEQERLQLKQQLRHKDRRIAELEKLVDSSNGNATDINKNSGHDSFASLTSLGDAGGDAIWNRLQVQLNQTREELSQKDDALQAQTASLELQKNRVAELERELQNHKQSTIQKLKDEVAQLQKDKKELSDLLQAERREVEDRMQKKDEALVYFRNELQKLKETPIDDQRRAMLSASTHSQSSQSSLTVQRAFGGLSSLVSPALWNKDRANMDNASISTPRMDD